MKTAEYWKAFPKTAEEYWKAFPKHKPAKDADIAEAMREYAKLYASEAIREKEETINKLKDRLEKAWQREDIKPKELDLIMQLSAKGKEIEQLREALATVTKEQLHTTVKAQLSGKTEQFTGPVVGIEDGTEFNNAR
jgi:exonuclease VII large subunit